MNLIAFVFLLLTLKSSVSVTYGLTSVPVGCVTPSGENAHCISLFACPHLIKSLSTLTPEASEYVRGSLCQDNRPNDVMVCCGTPQKNTFLDATLEEKDIHISEHPMVQDATSEKITTENVHISETMTQSATLGSDDVEPPHYLLALDSVDNDSLDEKVKARREYAKAKVLLSTKYCGLQQTDDRFNFKDRTELDEFPWIAHLRPIVDESILILSKCIGVLINNRYVLTNWLCGDQAVIVTLGQYKPNESLTCLDVEQGDCSLPKVDYKIESKIPSRIDGGPIYIRLMLLRLEKKVAFTDYIRPICLPVDGSKRSSNENYLTFSGWGDSSGNAPVGVIKKKITYNITDDSMCYERQQFANIEKQVKAAGFRHVCLKRPPGNTDKVCEGERGAPLMYKSRNNWYADGLILHAISAVSFTGCDSQNLISGLFITPNVMNWILDNIKD